LPFKANAAGRHHIAKQMRRVTNWRIYEAGLGQRVRLTVWFAEAAIAAWQAGPPDEPERGQGRYLALAIQAALTPRADTVNLSSMNSGRRVGWDRGHRKFGSVAIAMLATSARALNA
jgi:hypothetical protein